MSTTITPRQARVHIFQGDDEARILELRAEADRLKPDQKRVTQPRLLHEDPEGEYVRACEAHDEFKREAETRALVITVQALRRKQWRSLVAANPPREDDAGDKQLGVNILTFPEALVPASIVAPTFDSPADRDDFLDQLSDAQYDELFWTAFRLNRGGGVDPKDFLASAPSSSATEN
jgi:hypothetical protein